MRHRSIRSESLIGGFAGIPIAIAWFQFQRGQSLLAALVLGIALWPSGFLASWVSLYLTQLAPHAPRARFVSYAVSGLLGIVVAYPSFWMLLSIHNRPWIPLTAIELIPAAATGLLASYAAQRWVVSTESVKTASKQNQEP
jgi:hypothetical protein